MSMLLIIELIVRRVHPGHLGLDLVARCRAPLEAATEALAGHWAGMRHTRWCLGEPARKWTDAASERSNAASGSSGSP
eukprot:7294890-Prymnesium_polylepis.1